MQVYTRITSPYMPQGTPNSTNAPSPFYAPGEIGCAFNDQSTNRTHLRVKLDSGATSATPVGAALATQVAFWKDKTNGIVTNDKRFADVGPSGAINRIAGIFPCNVTGGGGALGSDGLPLYYMCDIVIAGKSVSVASDNSGVIGGTAMADTTASVSRVVGGAAVNTAPVSQVIGYNVSAPSGALVNVDVELGWAG